MPQKRGAARGQQSEKRTAKKPAKPAKVPSLKKMNAPKSAAKATPVPKSKGKAPAAKAEVQITQAKEALKKESVNSAKFASAKAETKARGRKISIEIDPGEAASALSGKWSTLYKKAEQIESKPYNMKAVFEEKTAIVHKVLGWGYILTNRNDRLEVLFKDGIKYLISNYKP